MFNKYPKTKFDLDDIFICLAYSKKQQSLPVTNIQINAGSIIPTNPKICSQNLNKQIKQQKVELISKNGYSSNQMRKKTVQQDIQTARFNEQQDFRQQFKQLSFIKTIQLNSPKTLSLSGQTNDDFYKQKTQMKSNQLCFIENLKIIKSLVCLHKNSMQQKFIDQILNYGVYKNQTCNFYGIRIYEIDTNQVLQLLLQHKIIQIFKYIEALRIYKSQYHINFNPFFTPNLKIINLSQNNLITISFLKNCPDLQFLNLNHNRIKTLNPIKDLINLVQIHALDNFIQHPFISHSFVKLNIFDVSYNQICDLESLVILKNIHSLKVLNMTGNPLQKKNGYIKQISKCFPHIKSFQFPQASIFSDYNRYKDIAFFTQAQKKQFLKKDKKKRQSKQNIRKI